MRVCCRIFFSPRFYTTRKCLATFAGHMANMAASMFAQQCWELRFREITEINDSTGGATCFSTICDFAVIWTRNAQQKKMRNQMYAKYSASPFWSACCLASCAPKSDGRIKEDAEELYIYVSCARRRVRCIRLVRFRHSSAMDHAYCMQRGAVENAAYT